MSQQQNKCPACGAVNRPEAKFCRFCGSKLEVKDPVFTDFLGKKNIEEEFLKLQVRIKAARKLLDASAGARIGMDCLILGPTGSGKDFLARKIISMLVAEKLVSDPNPVIVDAVDWSGWSGKLDANLTAAKDKVLVITNAHKLVPQGNEQSINALDKLFVRMSGTGAGMPVVILTGLKSGLDSFFKSDPKAAALFECRFELKSLGKEDLSAICRDTVGKAYGLKFSAEAEVKLEKRFDWLLRNLQATAGGHRALQEASEIGIKAFMRGAGEVGPEDIDDQVYEPRTEEQIWAEFDAFTGLENVKKEIHAIIDSIKEARRRGKTAVVDDHYVFTGNPGTGKTTIARCFADMLGAVGVLPKGQFIELAGKDLISQYVGGTEDNVQEAVDNAMGGVLFIDEAYGLNDDKFGKAAIDKLVPMLENLKGQFVCILAGYTRDMEDFMRANAGLASRFNKVIEFPDYNPVELEQIYRGMVAKKGLSLNDEADQKLHFEMEKMYNRRTDNFGNARDVRNRVKMAEERRRERIRSLSDEEILAEGDVLTFEDVAGEEAVKEINIDDVMKDLDALVGLDSVKQNIRDLAFNIRRMKQLAEKKGTSPHIEVGHYQFLGNPGTGKTTVARLMGKVFYSLGVLSRPDVIEVNRSELVAQYEGQTAPLTKKAVQDAMGGVLFIDEAYSLVNGERDDFGKECVNTLVPLLENNVGKFVCICAGYTREMQNFLAVNSGLKSRLTNEIVFEDYDADALYQIFLLNCKKEGLVLGDGVEEAARAKMKQMYERRGYDFGNARDVRNYVKKVASHIGERTRSIDDPSEAELTTIIPEDLI